MNKQELVSEFKKIFQKNKNTGYLAVFLSTYFFDSIFNEYLVGYIGKISINDTNEIKKTIEKNLEIDLNEYFDEEELRNLYDICKQYIMILVDNNLIEMLG
jgi:hypothetical protein